MKQYELTSFNLDDLKIVERPDPEPGPNQVAVRLHAASLNYRDLMMVKGIYNPKTRFPAVLCSDGAGEVLAIGPGVSRWKVGDRVCPIFNQSWIDGSPSAEKNRATLGGGDVDGVLRDVGVFHEEGLVSIPDHLSFEEAATLPCAAVTVWNALVVSGTLKSGDTVLTLGTGGVSVFAIQFAKLHGATVIATSSSDDKLARARELGADETINYRTNPEWDNEVLRLTGRRGVDHVVEVGGAGTLARSARAVRVGGHIAMIGVLSSGNDFNPISLLMKGVRLQGIFVGSRVMFEDMNRAVSSAKIKPVIDRVFSFEDAVEAMRLMEKGGHFGKIVVRI